MSAEHPEVVEWDWTCGWCRQDILPQQPWLLRARPGQDPDAFHHDCYVYGVLPQEQRLLRMRHAERMAALQEPRKQEVGPGL